MRVDFETRRGALKGTAAVVGGGLLARFLGALHVEAQADGFSATVASRKPSYSPGADRVGEVGIGFGLPVIVEHQGPVFRKDGHPVVVTEVGNVSEVTRLRGSLDFFQRTQPDRFREVAELVKQIRVVGAGSAMLPNGEMRLGVESLKIGVAITENGKRVGVGGVVTHEYAHLRQINEGRFHVLPSNQVETEALDQQLSFTLHYVGRPPYSTDKPFQDDLQELARWIMGNLECASSSNPKPGCAYWEVPFEKRNW